MEPQNNKGKPVTTSVPTISIRFHANAEQLEELYGSDEEHLHSESVESTVNICTAASSEPESRSLKYLSRLGKRSSSIDISASALDASPPSSDPWRFFSDIKGKITKSVEEKITEIKARNQEEGSPLKIKALRDNSKDNSSVSDSEEFSESSISKTCGIVSTTEGAEMSSDDDTPSIDKDPKPKEENGGLRRRFRFLKNKTIAKEGTITKSNLSKMYNINTDKIEQALPEDDDVESAVDALEDSNLQHSDSAATNELVLSLLENQFDNIEIDNDNVVNVKEVQGKDVGGFNWPGRRPKTIYAPTGFVDLRPRHEKIERDSFTLPVVMMLVFGVAYFLIHSYSSYLAGIIVGMVSTYLFYYLKFLLDTPSHQIVKPEREIVEVPAVKEFQPYAKYEGWVNELPETYNPHTYHICQTQSVYLRLQENLLRVSHTRSKVPKRALWNAPKITPVFTHHRIYNLLDAKISLLPNKLAKKRHWSKKYPICITLNSDNQLEFETNKEEEDEDEKIQPTKIDPKPKRSFPFRKRKPQLVISQRFSKLTEENEEYELDSETSRASTPSPPSPDLSDLPKLLDDKTEAILDKTLEEHLLKEDDTDILSLPDDWSTFTDDSPTETRLYIFGRTDREKEDWFRRFTAGTHKKQSDTSIELLNIDNTGESPLIEGAKTETDFVKFMSILNKGPRFSFDPTSEDNSYSADSQWISAFIGRILFDCLHDDTFTQRIKDRIQRKLGSIKLPYFIEELILTELNLGCTPPLITRAKKTRLDERGLWVDLDIKYEGLVVLILQTKLNLMRLKQQAPDRRASGERLAMFNSDLDDSAESTSDEDNLNLLQNPAPLDASGFPIAGLGGTSNTSKRFIKMVDRLAESKFFQAATENRYIKKAMEGVSNTDLRLKVDIKELVGTMVLNIPAPPSDRIWIGFRPIPTLALTAQPIVGERNITFIRITSWIEKMLVQEFHKLMVIPNMEDFSIPVMIHELPH